MSGVRGAAGGREGSHREKAILPLELIHSVLDLDVQRRPRGREEAVIGACLEGGAGDARRYERREAANGDSSYS